MIDRGRLGLLVALGVLGGCPGDDSTNATGGTSGLPPTTVTLTSGPDTSTTDDSATSMGSGDAGSETGIDPDSTGSAPACGNGIIEGDEICDDAGESARCDDDCSLPVCGDEIVNEAAGEACDDGDESPTCDDDCTLPECGDGNTNQMAGETCDDMGFSIGCDDDCTFTECGDGVYNPNAGELCDEGLDSPTCDPDCTLPECGDGVVNMAAGEDCDEGSESATCDFDCTTPVCGDGYANADAGEDCDDMGESAACDADCTLVECGDGIINMVAGETCDDGIATPTCDVDCTPPVCGDGIANPAAGEECDDGNMIPDDGCTMCTLDAGFCGAGSNLIGVNLAGTMMLCDDPADLTCEEDFEALCPVGWGLCTRLQHINRNDGWDVPLGGFGMPGVALGEILCRGGSGAGHYTLGPYDGVTNIMDDPPPNCGYGSSRPVCPSGFGCNEQEAYALCCAPALSCGNGVVDSIEEECDDGNLDETDDCLNSCSWRVPTAHGVPGVGC